MSKCEHDWYTFPSIKNKKVCIKCKVEEELPKPQWESEFDKEYDKSDKFITISENFSGFTETRPGKEEIKAFIKDQITKTQQEIAEQIIEELNKLKKEQLDTTDPDNYEACYAIAGFNDAISQAKDQLRIKYLNESEKV